MTTSAQKTRWSGSACRAVIRLCALSMFLGLSAACSHVPKETGGGKVRFRATSPDKGSVRLSILAPQADRVLLVIMRTLVLTPVIYEVQASRGSEGVWTADMDLVPGEYRFFFIVDGSVTVEGAMGRVEQDDFGGQTGVLKVHRTSEGFLGSF
jgi:hypothetical protein